jgi:hypothetical protein
MKLKKWFSLFLSLVLLYAGMPLGQAAISNLINTPTPNTAGSNASQRIRFINAVTIPVGGRVELTFPQQFDLNSGGDWIPADITLNFQGGPAVTVSDVIRNGQKISFGIGGVPSGVGFQEFTLNALRVINPPTPGTYTVSLTTLGITGTQLEGTATSASFEIIQNMSAASVTVEPDIAGANSKMTIQFRLGTGTSRSLYTGDRIRIAFDANVVDLTKVTTVPGTIQRTFLKVNQSAVNTDPTITPGEPGVSRGIVEVIIPQNITSSATQGAAVTITFEAGAGILNPNDAPWTRRVEVTTLRSNGTTIIEGPVASNFYAIRTTVAAPKVFVRPEIVGMNAEYHLSMKLGANSSLLKNSGRIDVIFPEGTQMPASIPASAIRINTAVAEPAFPCDGPDSPPFEPLVSGHKVSFVMPVDAVANSFICVVFKASSGIKNPTNPGVYHLQLSTSSDPSIISSQSYSIRLSGRAQVTPDPAKSSERAQYTLHFQTGVDGALYPFGTAGTNKNIMITYPAGFILPAGIAAGLITVNGVATTEAAVIAGQLITFPVPQVIENNSSVTIIIKKDAGIINRKIAESPEYHSLVIETDKEKGPNKIISDQFMLYSPITDVYVTPGDLGVGVVSRYEVSFKIGDVVEGLKPNDRISIEFPAGTTLPSFISTGNVRLQNDAGVSPSSLIITGNTIHLTLPATFVPVPPPPGINNVKVIFFQSCGIRNPDNPGSYRATVYTSRESTPVLSEFYTIGTVSGQVQVTVDPNKTGYCTTSPEGAHYTVQFTTGQTGGVSSGQRIMLVFSPEYGPIFAVNHPLNLIPAGTILVNGIPTQINSIIDNAPTPQHPAGSKMLSIISPVSISSQSVVKIDLLSSANIDNPPVSITPQPFFMRVFTDSEPSVISGLYYLISTLRGIGAGCHDPLGVQLTNQLTRMGTDIKISMRTGIVGALNSGSDRIRVKFPSETHIPSFISGQYIRINTIDNFATSVSVLNPSISDKTVAFEVPYGVTIGNNATVFIYFQQGGGIVNPSIPGNYQLFVSSTKEPTEVASLHYTIEGISVSRPTVAPLPTLAGAEKTQYTVKFMTGAYGSLNIGDTINFEFPAGTDIDPTPPRNPLDPRTISSQHVLVNGVPCIIAPTVISATQVMIYSPVVVPSNSRVTILFTKDAKIKNPVAAGDLYTLRMWTMREGSSSNPLVSDSYEISSATKITKPVVTVSPCTPYSPSRYVLEFYTPTPMVANVDAFDIDFPSGTFIPSSMDASKILFSTQDNQNVSCQINPVIAAYRITLTTPINVNANSYVKIDFLRDAGLQNPVAGNYNLQIATVGAIPPNQNESYAYYICPDLDFGRLEITPSSMRLPVGKTQIFVARAYDTQGQLMDYGVTYRWNLSSSIGLLENNHTQTTEFYARNMGSANLSVVAEYGNRSISTSVSVVVTGPMTRIQLTPSGITTSRGQKTRFSVQAFDANNEAAEGVLYDWSVSPELGVITPIPLSDEVEFHADTEGQCVIRVRGTQGGLVQEAEAQVTIKVGVNNLVIMPSQLGSNPQPGEILGPFTVELQNPMNQAITAFTETPITLSSTTPHGRFSLDGINWTSSNQLHTSIMTNFDKTQPFYICVLEAGDCTIVASSDDYNSFLMPLSIRGHKKGMVFLTPPQNLRRNVISEKINIQIQDILGQPYAVNKDTMIQLNSSSPQGQFSKSMEPWIPLEKFLLSPNQHTLELYYRDSREGTLSITASNALFGSVSQIYNVASPGAVSAPEVVVRPAVSGLSASYQISFHVGFDGALEASRDFIEVLFPEGTRLPFSIPASMITVNSQTLVQTPVINTTQRSIRMILPTSISATERVDLLIPSIGNPERTGKYTLKVATSVQATYSDSQPYTIDYSTISDLVCEAVPSIAGSVAEQRISFKTGLKGAMEAEQDITLLFDFAFELPAMISSSHVFFNGIPLPFDPTVSGKAIILKTPRSIPAETLVSIVFSKECGIKNPLYPGTYYIQGFTSAEQALIKSAPIDIVQHSLIRDLIIKPQPAMISKGAEYTITFVTGPYGALTQEDFITLSMADLMMPLSLPPSSVAINNIRIQQAIAVQNNTLQIPVPAFIPASEKITIVIYRQAGIVNPSKPANDYRIMAHTSKEPYPVSSAPFTIEPQLEITHMINPPNPDGANNWYINEPMLIFTSNVQARIYYRIDQGAEREYIEPIRLSEHGQHTVYYRGTSLLGNESEMKSFTFQYDGTAPIIETNIGEDISYTREQRMAFTILIKDISRVTLSINDLPIQLINNSYSTILDLKTGENNFVIRAMDEAGNVSTLHKKIIFKSQPPMLLITAPTSFQMIQDIYFATSSTGSELFANVRIKGSTEIGVESLELISDTFKGFSVAIPVDELGNFDRVIGIRSMAGDNVLTIKAVDQVGNETRVMISYILRITVRLRIGVETGYVNGTPVQLGSKPYLKYNKHTMVPFRLIAESLGATVGWEQATRKVSYDFRGVHIDLWIGGKTAEVTDPSGRRRSVSLLAEPELLNGRTWVPLRFVSEALGAKVDWDPKLWEAIVSYP